MSTTQWEREELDRIVAMCEHLERSWKKLTQEEHKSLPVGTYSFEGLDGNDSYESRLKEAIPSRYRVLRPGMQMMAKYRRMWERYSLEMKEKEFLTVEDMIKIVN